MPSRHIFRLNLSRTISISRRISRQAPENIEHLVQATVAQQRQKPAILGYLALGFIASGLGYIGYRVTILNETVFVPYGVSSHERLANDQEVDHAEVKAMALQRVLEKCGLDEVVTGALGVPLVLDDAHDAGIYEFNIWIVTQGPSLNGIEIRPQWPFFQTACRTIDLDIFSESDTTGLLVTNNPESTIMGGQDADPDSNTDANKLRPRRQMVVCGRICLVGCSSQRKGELTFRLYSDYDRKNSPLAFGMGLLTYIDSSTGKPVEQRLW
ncbi:hypothetical protein NADFUDRAFT_44091 [Nadsonia fulvescens var. elongata DSM 6958]|uniref:Uncharacterized protein n=1 Tax=Nadsonia fulvescens var. elongata DSM 6958 TaxID=857566 RepID=A0A1E3PCN6_9ASCO|nr:hypothetical protein NADFUDRAFT_44091 [Nadsonia fulvescens var. elongata DSM 6958]